MGRQFSSSSQIGSLGGHNPTPLARSSPEPPLIDFHVGDPTIIVINATLNGKTWNQFRKENVARLPLLPRPPLHQKVLQQKRRHRRPKATRYFRRPSRPRTPRCRPARRECTSVLTSTGPIRRPQAMAALLGSKKVAATTASATSGLRAKRSSVACLCPKPNDQSLAVLGTTEGSCCLP
jgi:hypothetical protein